MIYIKGHRRKAENLRRDFPEAVILDLTSKSSYARKLSPFYPHGCIPVPFSDGVTSESVEGVWQGLKVFQTEGIDTNCFRNATMKGLKRTVRTHGPCLGHQRGVYGSPTDLLSYIEARKQIYVPTYRWMLEHCPDVAVLLARIGEKAEVSDMVFLDYNTNEDIDDARRPLSHVSLVKRYIEEHYPLSLERHSSVPPKTRGKSIRQPSLFGE